MKPSSFLLSASTIIAFLGITSCAPKSQERDISSKDSDSNKILAPGENSKTTAFLHDKEIDTYLTSVKGFLLEMPNDKIFGGSRIEPIAKHFSRASAVKGYSEVQNLTGEFAIRTFVIGTKKPNEVNVNTPNPGYPSDPKKLAAITVKMNPAVLKNFKILMEASAEGFRRINPKKLVASSVRMKEVVADEYKLLSADRKYVRIQAQVIEPELVDAVLKLKPMLDEKGYDTYSEPIKVNGVMGNLMAKAVRAPNNECLKCHANIKPGQPIGYAMATIWKNTPK